MAKEFKVTKNMTKAYLGSVLTANIKAAKELDKSLADRVSYTLTNLDAKDTSRNEVAKLVKELATTLGDKFVQPPIPDSPKTENLVKKTSDDGDETIEKSKGKKKKTLTGDSRMVIYATSQVFPETFTIENGGGTFHIVHDEVKTLKDMLNLDSDEDEGYKMNGTYFFAFWWTKRHLRQFPYFNDDLGHPKEFAEHGTKDLDFAQLFYISDEGKVAYAVSDLTEAPYTILPADLEEVDGVRIGSRSSIEFAIYKMDEDEETPDEDNDDIDDTDEDKAF